MSVASSQQYQGTQMYSLNYMPNSISVCCVIAQKAAKHTVIHFLPHPEGWRRELEKQNKKTETKSHGLRKGEKRGRDGGGEGELKRIYKRSVAQ